MISILIPIYNYNISTLITELRSQLNVLQVEYEIICVDDSSLLFVSDNQLIVCDDKFELLLLSENIGRSKIRNLLASKANYEWLLFLDADVLPKNKNFIKMYLYQIKDQQNTVFSGGVNYERILIDKNCALRWKYGTEKEQIPVGIRKKNPYQYFLSSNFLIKKNTFNKIKFNENLIKYGYEDVFFSSELQENNIQIKHIENPVFHMGLEPSPVFLIKTRESLHNLKILLELKNGNLENVKLLKAYRKLRILKFDSFFGFIYTNCKKSMEWNLKSKYPSLVVFNIYKLCYFSFINLEKE